MQKIYRVTREYKVRVPERGSREYNELIEYFRTRDPEFFDELEQRPLPEGTSVEELVDQQIPYWITYAHDVGDLTRFVIDTDATAKEVRNAQVPFKR